MARAGVRVNLLFSGQAHRVSVKSHLSSEARVDIENASGRNVLVRVPEWVPPSEINLRVEGERRPVRIVGAYVLAAGSDGCQTINIRFPMRKERTVESISFTEYTIDWAGDQIVAMSPPAEHLPMFPPCK